MIVTLERRSMPWKLSQTSRGSCQRTRKRSQLVSAVKSLTNPTEGIPYVRCRSCWVRRAAHSGLSEELRREVKRRVPPVPEPAGITETEDEYASELVLDAATLLTPTVIRTAQDLEGWLASLREKIAAFLKEKKSVRIKSGME